MSEIQRIPHASHWGAYTLLVRDGKIVGTEAFAGDPAPSPIIHSVKDWADPTHRIKQPMVRRSWLDNRETSRGEDRGREEFVPVSWDKALDLTASEINRVRRDHGNASIYAGSYGWTSAGRIHHAASLLKRMMNLVGGYTGHVDTYSIAAGPVILRHVLGSDDACSGRANTLDTIAEHTETLVVFGALAPRTAQIESGGLGRHTLELHLKKLTERGVKIVLVSPLRDDLPEWVNFEWMPIRPNTDAALMLALAGEIVAAGKHDRDFLERCCSGVDVLLDHLAGKGDGIVKNAAWGESITGVPAEAIRALAKRLPDTRSMLTVSWSLQRAHHGEQPFWAALALASIAGHIGLPGGGVGYGYGSLGGVGAPIGVAKSPAMPQGGKPNPDFIPVARIADLLLNPGDTFTYQGRSYKYPDTKLVYWAGGNPYHHHQDLNRLRRAWAKPETIIVQDPMWTATARRADIVLPASTSIERNDIAGARRTTHIMAMHKAIAPVGEARSDFDIFSALAERLGVGEPFTEGLDEMAWIRRVYNDTREDARLRHQHVMPDFETFWREGIAEVPVREDVTYLADFRENPEAHPLGTESRKIVLGSKTLAKLGYDDCLAHPAFIPPAEWLGDERAKEMLHLVSHQPLGKLHSQLDSSEYSQSTKRNGREQVRIHPDDAEARDIRDGDAVRLWNARGQCLATAQVTDSVRSGVAILPTGSWYAPADESDNALELSGNPNVLTLDVGTSKFGQGCAAHTCLVAIEPYRELNVA
ncbi:dimethyl sulfoxide/trimethylamine N-oxide reductase precursor [Variibacter gotjawalensis]|uniref:Dimethyl sulfoxide/trimethylamine N-oxide reductase n=1 Tax=Variibacter gotjawalensis TaxID=1333996 RepID=A0A0S3PZR4_9BRAD|nr:molybdopterin-dependent oxidoreductase [Variibacter gotjawalensis]NIK47263.1 biotin/methionine sulfoxide reductase [Variibacter gotjawalensis]RZS49163.1 biotin/methionine sulfoxide reductase [Variibacter gotjawalensis]BAT61425.1 dimethyl sulfoxide/trimethylamine N-oxide reductase precursor [Variibacter gotjawalensis]